MVEINWHFCQNSIVAKGALLLPPNMNVSSASIIINLVTPHTPSLVLDSVFANYYYKLEKYLYKINDAGVKVVSIGGGSRDILVSAARTFDRTVDINVLSTSVLTVWKSTDHLSILWCKREREREK
jgi:GPI inositol-deacylase